MKRTVALLLIVVFILAAFASAAPEDNSAGTQSVATLSLSYSGIEDQVLKNNPTVRSNNNTLENMNDPDGIVAARNDLFTQAAKIDMSVAGLLTASGGAASPNILQLAYAANALRAQGQILKAPDDDTIEETKWQLDQINYTMVTVSQSLFTTYLSMERQLDNMQKSVGVMNKTLEIMKLRYGFGQISILDLEAFQNQKASMGSGAQSLEVGLETLKGEINMQLGRAFDAPLELMPLPSPDFTYIEKIDRSADLLKAKGASYSLKLKQRAIKDADDTDFDDKQYDTFKRDYENKVLAVKTEEETIRFTQQKLLDAISEKKRTLVIEQSNLTLEQKKLKAYELNSNLAQSRSLIL